MIAFVSIFLEDLGRISAAFIDFLLWVLSAIAS
jgi:hypothetical protein